MIEMKFIYENHMKDMLRISSEKHKRDVRYCCAFVINEISDVIDTFNRHKSINDNDLGIKFN